MMTSPTTGAPSVAALSKVQELHAQVQQKRTYSLHKIWDQEYTNTVQAQPKLLEQLTVTTSPERMQQIFDKHAVIVLREPTGSEKSLLLFCGNKPVHSNAMRMTYDSEGREKHSHPGSFTIDCDPLMNPSMITEWPSSGAIAYLKEKGCRFKHIKGESMPLTHTFLDTVKDLQETLKALSDLLAEGGVAETEWSLLVKGSRSITQEEGELLGSRWVPYEEALVLKPEHANDVERLKEYLEDTITQKALKTIRECAKSHQLLCDIEITSTRYTPGYPNQLSQYYKMRFTKRCEP